MDSFLIYKIFPEKKLIVECVRGIVYLDDYIRLKSQECQDVLFYPTYNLILDLLGSKIQGLDSELHQLVDYLKRNPAFDGKRNVVVLTDSPNQVVTVELFHLYYRQKNTKLKIASTLKTALDWVGLSESHLEFLTNTLKELTTINTFPTTTIVHE